MWKKTGAVYDGDWKDNMRHGFGMYSVKQGDAYVKQYAGGWKEDMRDVSCIYIRTYILGQLNVTSLHSTHTATYFDTVKPLSLIICTYVHMCIRIRI